MCLWCAAVRKKVVQHVLHRVCSHFVLTCFLDDPITSGQFWVGSQFALTCITSLFYMEINMYITGTNVHNVFTERNNLMYNIWQIYTINLCVAAHHNINIVHIDFSIFNSLSQTQHVLPSHRFYLGRLPGYINERQKYIWRPILAIFIFLFFLLSVRETNAVRD